MSEGKHTPGPWAAFTDEVGNHTNIVKFSSDPKEPSVRQVFSLPGRDKREPDVMLATAAPDLLEAVMPMKRGAKDADYYCPDDVPDDHVVLIEVTIGELRAARAAITKASGAAQ